MNDNLPASVEPRRLPTLTTWLAIAARSFAVAAVVGAGQLGTAQAVGMLVWSPAPAADGWRRQLVWLVFIFAASVLAGVAGGHRSVRAVRRAIATRRAAAAATRRRRVPTSGPVSHRRPKMSARNRIIDAARWTLAALSRLSATLFASLGAAVSYALVWLAARDTLDPADLRLLTTAAGTGIAVGAVVSLVSLAAAPVAANAAIWLGAGWILGLASVATVIAVADQSSTPLLGTLDIARLIDTDDWWLKPDVMVALAVVFAGAVAALARWVGEPRLAVALSGPAGPSIIAAGYLLVGPGDDLARSHDAAALAVAAGLLASIVIAVLPRRRRTSPAPAPAAAPAASLPTLPTSVEVGGWDQQLVTFPEPAADPIPPVAEPAPAAERVPTTELVPAAFVRAAPAAMTSAWELTAAPHTSMPAPAPAEHPTPTVEHPTPMEHPTPLMEHPTPTPAAPPSAAQHDTDSERSRWARRLDRDTQRLGKREREHVDWVKHLVSIPPDPTLLTREK